VECPCGGGDLLAPGRIYRLFQVRILDPALVAAVLTRSERYSDQDLRDLALEDVRNGGRGRANGVLALPVGVLRERKSHILYGQRLGIAERKGPPWS
jgi:hypothetical protein